jgi:hypothetical protein
MDGLSENLCLEYFSTKSDSREKLTVQAQALTGAREKRSLAFQF